MKRSNNNHKDLGVIVEALKLDFLLDNVFLDKKLELQVKDIMKRKGWKIIYKPYHRNNMFTLIGKKQSSFIVVGYG